MRVLLLKPYQRVPGPVMAPPLGLLCLIAELRERFGDELEIELMDMKVRRLEPSWVRGKLESFRPDVVGLSVLNCEAQSAKDIAAIVKDFDSSILTVLGGPYAHQRSEEILSSSQFDWTFNGPADRVFPEALSRYMNGEPLGTDLPGLSYKTGDGIHGVKTQDVIKDLDALPMPAWDLIDFDIYAKEPNQMVSLKGERYALLFTSRGCPYLCNYCHDIFGKRFYMQSAERILEEIRYLYEERGVDEFQLIDDIFNLHKPRLKKVFGEVARRWPGKIHFSFPNGVRADILDEEVLDAMKAGGVYALAIAIETATPRLQELIDKHLKIEKAAWAIDECDKRGFLTMGFFMLGFPTETEAELKATIDFALKSRLTMANFFHVVPQVATPIHPLALKEGGAEALEATMRDEEVDGANYRDALPWYERAYGYPLRALTRKAYLRFYLAPKRMTRVLGRFPLKTLKLAVVQFLRVAFTRTKIAVHRPE